jgi:hypothetical protein
VQLPTDLPPAHESDGSHGAVDPAKETISKHKLGICHEYELLPSSKVGDHMPDIGPEGLRTATMSIWDGKHQYVITTIATSRSGTLDPTSFMINSP